MQGEADRIARLRQTTLGRAKIGEIIRGGLHEYLGAYLGENARLDQAIGQQFRFG